MRSNIKCLTSSQHLKEACTQKQTAGCRKFVPSTYLTWHVIEPGTEKGWERGRVGIGGEGEGEERGGEGGKGVGGGGGNVLAHYVGHLKERKSFLVNTQVKGLYNDRKEMTKGGWEGGVGGFPTLNPNTRQLEYSQ